MSLSAHEQYLILTTERVSSVFSILGAFFVITTFIFSPSFHKNVNRLVFYASWGNLITNIATMVSLSGIDAGQDSSLCQGQSFLIQMFMPADSLWTFCMACNVYLTFRRRFSGEQLRQLEWKYFLACYGIPAIPALVFLFIRDKNESRVYGPAQLWCWISVDWDALRIACFYAPVWVIFLTTIAIYTSIGAEIYKKRRQLRSVTYSLSTHEYTAYKTTEILVTRQDRDEQHFELQERETTPKDDSSTPAANKQAHFTADVTTGSANNHTKSTPAKTPAKRPVVNNMSPSDRAAWAYTKTAMLFFIALVITWVPSTINRIYTLVNSGEVSFALSYFEALVLPLQGFWNAIIYIATSISACKELWARQRNYFSREKQGMSYLDGGDDNNNKSESTTELASHQ